MRDEAGEVLQEQVVQNPADWVGGESNQSPGALPIPPVHPASYNSEVHFGSGFFCYAYRMGPGS